MCCLCTACDGSLFVLLVLGSSGNNPIWFLQCWVKGQNMDYISSDHKEAKDISNFLVAFNKMEYRWKINGN